MAVMYKGVKHFKSVFLLSWLSLAVHAQPAHLNFAAIQGAPYTPVQICFLTRFYSDMGLNMSYTLLPARRALLLSAKGKLDGELYRIEEVAASHPSLLIVRPALTEMKVYAFSSLPLADGIGWQRLSGLRVGYIQGYRYAEKGALAGRQQVAVQRPEQLISMYNKGRLDLIIMDDLQALQYQKVLAAAGLRRAEPALQTIKFFHFLHEQHAERVQPVSEHLQRWVLSGRRDKELAECMRQYGVPNK